MREISNSNKIHSFLSIFGYFNFRMHCILSNCLTAIVKMCRISCCYLKQINFHKSEGVYLLRMAEAAVCRCSSKYMLLKVSQNSPENTCVGDSF